MHGELYGTSRTEYDRAVRDGVDLLLDLDVQGADQVRQKFADAVTVFILPPSYADLERRLRGRGPDDEASFQRRLAVAGEEMSHFRKYDYAIVNEDLEASVEDLKTVIRAARLRTSRVAETAEKILSTFQTRQGEMREMSQAQLILPKDVDSKFRFITVASQRAKQLQNGAKPRVETKSRKPTRVAMQEVLAGAVSWEVRDEVPQSP